MILFGDLHANAVGELEFIRPEFIYSKYGDLVVQERFLIILGDAGFLLGGRDNQSGGRLLNYFDKLPWTTICVPGNHENYKAVYDKENLVKRQGQEFYQVSDNVYFFKRYGAYEIEDKKLLILGGALSTDKIYRTEGETWFKEECYTEAEQKEIKKTLSGAKFDAVLAHTMPLSVATVLFKHASPKDTNSIFFDKFKDKISFRNWFCGHFHENKSIVINNRKYQTFYKESSLF